MRVANIVVISDTHIGCKTALCPPDGIVLDEGGPPPISPWQRVLWSWWEEFWGEFVPLATRGEPYVVVHNGDAVEGSHHKATTPVTHNLHDQDLLCEKVLKPVVALCDGRYFHVRGTETHVDRSGAHEEAVAKMLGAVTNEEGRHSRQGLTLELGDRRINFMHHIGTTSSPFAQSGALQRLLVRSYVETGRRGAPPYSMLVRSHRHQHSIIHEEAAHGKVTVVTTPAWQGKTPYVFSRDGLQLSEPEIGGVVIRLADGELFTRAFVRRPDPPAAVIV